MTRQVYDKTGETSDYLEKNLLQQEQVYFHYLGKTDL